MLTHGLMLGLTAAKVLSQPLQLVTAGGTVNTGTQQHLCQQHTHLLSGPCTRHLDVQPKHRQLPLQQLFSKKLETCCEGLANGSMLLGPNNDS